MRRKMHKIAFKGTIMHGTQRFSELISGKPTVLRESGEEG